MKLTILILFTFVVLAVGFQIGELTHFSHPSATLGINIPPNDAIATTTSAIASTTATLMLAEQSGAQLRTLSNKTGLTVWLSFNSTSTGFTAGTGYELYPSTTIELSDGRGNLYTGNIWGITSAGTSSVSIMQL